MERRPADERNQTCAIRPPMSACGRLGDILNRALRVRRACRVVLGHRPALGLVGVEQRGPGPTPQYPGELPAEVMAVVDGGVHSVTAPRRHPVRGVSDEERAVLPEALRELGGEGERADALDAGLQGRVADGEPDAAPKLLLRGAGQMLATGPDPRAVQPAITPARRQDDAGGVGVVDVVEGVAALAEEFPQRRAKQRRHRPVEIAGPVHRDAQGRSYRAVRAVGANEVARVNRPRLSRGDVAQSGADALRAGLHRGDLGGEPHAGGAE